MLDNFRGPVEAFVHDANIEDLAGNKLNVSASPPVRVVLIDNQVPSLVSLEVPSQIGMNPFDVTIEVSEDSSVIDDTLLRVENGDRSPLVAVSGSDRRFTTRIQPDGNGPVSIQFEAGMFMDEAGNRSTFMASRSLQFDSTKPTVTITTQGTSKNGAFQALITFSEDVDGFTQSDITSTNATLSGFSDGPRGYSVLVTPTVSEGTVTLEIAADSATDIGLNGNEASETVSVEVDQIKPTVTITGVPAATRTTPFTITVTGSELTVGLEDDDLVLTNATATGFNSSGSNDAPYIYTAVIAPDGNGDVSVSVPADVMSDRFGNLNTASAVRTAILDNNAPEFSITGVPAVTGTAPFTATFTISETAPGFTVDDIVLANAEATSFDDTNAPVYTALITPDGNGDVSVSVAAGAVQDAAGNANAASAVATAVLDTAAPSIMISGVPAVTGTAPFTASFTLSEYVPGFTVDDLVLTKAAATSFDETNAPVYTAVITPDGTGDVSVSVAAGAVQDAAGNANAASAVATAVLDTAAPLITISGVPAITGMLPFIATFTISETASGFAVDDLVLANATESSFDDTNAPVYTALITPDGTGDVSVSVAAGAVKDAAGNPNAASAVATAVLDTAAPSIMISGVPAVTGTAPFTASFTLSENVPGFTVDDLVLTNATESSFDDTNAPLYTALITPDGTGDVSVSVAAGAIQDAAGNPNAASAVASAVLDTAAPLITISGVPAVTGTAPFTASFTLSENVPGFTVDDLVLANATESSFDDTNAPVYTALITPDGTGDVSVSVAAGAVKDAAGNPNAASAVATAVLDISAPAVWFNGVPGSTGPAGFVATIVVSEATTGFDISDLVLVNASASGFDPANAPVFTVQITPNGNGDVSLLVPADSMVDTAGIGNAASGNVIVTLDTAPPAVSSITAEDSDPANGQLSWKVTFSESVQGVGPANFTVEGVSGANMTVTPLGQRQGSLDPMTPAGFLRELFGVVSAHAAIPQATQYLVTVSGGNVATLTGSAVLVFGSAAGITDASGQGLVSVTPTGINQSTINPDTDAPSVAQIVAPAQVEGAFDANVIFSEPVNGFAATDLTVTNATVDAVTPQAPAGGFATVFTVRLTPLAHGPLTVAVVAGAAADAAGNQSTASGTLTISYLDTSYVQARTGAVIRNFLSQRATNILSNQPDLSGRLLDQGGFGATEQFAVSSNYGSGSLQLNFAGSLTRLMSGQAISDMADEKTYGYGGPGTGEESQQGRTTRFNLWVKGNLAKSKLDGNEQGFGTFHLGADYRATPDLMVGTLVQFDWADESNAAAATSASGTGWLAGPYAVYRLHENVVVDGYVAYGQSDNKVSPFGTYTDSFDTNRFLARGQITGDFDYAGWTIAPQLAASYLLETQEAYVDSNGVSIPEQDIEVGQLTFGPSFRKSHVLDNDVVLTPSLAVKGIWNFKSAGTANVTTGALSGSAQDKLRARLELGVGAKFNDNFRLTSSGYVDGLGQDGYSGYGGTLGLNLRF